MELGKHLRELFRMRIVGIVCLMLGVLAAVSASYKISLSPFGLEARSLQIASATAEVLVDTPYSTAVDLRQGSADIEVMTTRATLLGNVIASPPVLENIGRRLGVPPESIVAQAPLTADFPRPIMEPGKERASKDIFKDPEEYRINVQVDPSVPVLRVVAQAPTKEKAEQLADSAITGLQDYLDRAAAEAGTPTKDRVRLERLGRGHGVVVNGGVRPQASVVAFLVVFGLTSAAAMFIGRVVRGWREAGGGQPPAAVEGEEPTPARRTAETAVR